MASLNFPAAAPSGECRPAAPVHPNQSAERVAVVAVAVVAVVVVVRLPTGTGAMTRSQQP